MKNGHSPTWGSGRLFFVSFSLRDARIPMELDEKAFSEILSNHHRQRL